MKIEYDPNKNQRNIEERGLSFDLVYDFDFITARFSLDNRCDYGEVRHRALGYIGDRLYALTFVYRGEAIRVISLRKANKREVKHYEHISQNH